MELGGRERTNTRKVLLFNCFGWQTASYKFKMFLSLKLLPLSVSVWTLKLQKIVANKNTNTFCWYLN